MATKRWFVGLSLGMIGTLPLTAAGPRVASVQAVDTLPESPGALAPNHEFNMVVADLDQLCPTGRTSTPGKPLQVYLDGVLLPGSSPLDQQPDAQGTRLRFFLPTDAQTQPVWSWVARTTRVLDDPTVIVAVSVGYPDCTVSSLAQAMDAKFLILRRTLRYVWLFLSLGLAAALVWLARRTNLLRDPSPGKPYSLSKTQAAWWFYLILSGFGLVLMVTGFPPTLSNDVLILLGLSFMTGVVGGVIQGQATATKTGASQPGRGFWRDLLLDPGTGDISLGRLQFVAWTAVAGAYFAFRVLTTVSLPDVGNQLLLLQGISASAYVAVKNGESA